MISDYRLILILVILFFFPTIHDYLYWKRKETKDNHWSNNVIRKVKLDKKEENESITSSGHISHYKEEPPFNTTLANLPRLALDTSATGLSTTSEIKDSVENSLLPNHLLHGSMQRKLLHSHIQAKNSLHSPKRK